MIFLWNWNVMSFCMLVKITFGLKSVSQQAEYMCDLINLWYMLGEKSVFKETVACTVVFIF